MTCIIQVNRVRMFSYNQYESTKDWVHDGFSSCKICLNRFQSQKNKMKTIMHVQKKLGSVVHWVINIINYMSMCKVYCDAKSRIAQLVVLLYICYRLYNTYLFHWIIRAATNVWLSNEIRKQGLKGDCSIFHMWGGLKED